MSTERTWILLARKLSGEITAAESAEVEHLLSRDKQLEYRFSLLMQVLKAGTTNHITELDINNMERLLGKIKAGVKNEGM